jgi:hypothetical protein
MSGYGDRDVAAMDRVEDLLEAYAEGRLTASTPVLRRIRANVMAQAHIADRARHEPPTSARTLRILPGFHVPRRAYALGLAATLTLGTTAAVLAAPPGSPFYNARIAIEAALVPSQADPQMASIVQDLDARLAAAEAAAADGDIVRLTAALASYQGQVDQALSNVGDDLARLGRFEAVLAKHVAKLEALAARLAALPANDQAVENAVEHAIDVSQKAVKQIRETKAQSGRPSSPPAQQPSPPNRP